MRIKSDIWDALFNLVGAKHVSYLESIFTIYNKRAIDEADQIVIFVLMDVISEHAKIHYPGQEMAVLKEFERHCRAKK